MPARVAVSACLLGRNCKHSGGNNYCEDLVAALDERGCEVVAVCPEVAGGLPTPRLRSEIRDGAVVNEAGESVDAEFRAGAAAEFTRLVCAGGVDAAILQPRSPSCGVGAIYDGTFSGVLVPGDGIFARVLKEHGVPVVSPEEFLARG